MIQIGNCELYHGDCLEVMKDIPDKSIDMILCDLPYGTTACKWDTIIPFEPLWEQYKRIIKDNGAIVLFGSEPFSSYLRLSNIKQYKYDWKWIKNSSGGFSSAKKRPMKYHEDIIVFYKKQPIYNPIMREYADSVKHRYKYSQEVNTCKGIENNLSNNIQNIKKSKCEVNYERGSYPKSELQINGVPNFNGIRQHPTQKPVALGEYLVKTYTLEGETVLDNCMGSGSTGVACINTGRNFIGIEKDEKYFEIACERINNTIRETDMMLDLEI